MILIADSGSTKVEWRGIFDGNRVVEVTTEGINPVYQNRDKIVGILWNQLLKELPVTSGFTGSSIHFYGAGIVSSGLQEDIAECFRIVFPGAELRIQSDMMAAARAVCGNNAGIVCILGTGSNSCFYDGKDIKENVKAGGFILGDEGSGAYLGKRLLSDYIKGLLPKHLSDAFYLRYKLDYATIVNKVYRENIPSRFLASLTHFISDFQDDPYMKKLLADSFGAFLDRNVVRYNFKKYEIGFVGSVATAFESVLRRCAAEREMKIGKVMQRPGEGLVEYHKMELK